MKLRLYPILLLLFLSSAFVQARQHPKREFRGAWLQTAFQTQYASMNRETMQNYLRSQLDQLQQTGINAVIFQVRPMADAFYPSELEPWSRFFTGTQGAAPTPLWDPLEFMVNECHARNMELHAWVNPYRVSSNISEPLASNHIYFQHPEWFVQYGKGLYFDPGLPQSREFINRVVDDIVTRYDIDAIHMDDYFYPYPVDGKSFPDDNSYALYHKGMSRDDWRRDNVNTLIEELHQTIKNRKPWVRFGISPFGIYRNKRSDAGGSDTNGLQNYDDLYADVLLWTQKGWIDYSMPQLYWEIGHKAACSETLAYWWNRHANGRHLYIGQDVRRTMNAADVNPNFTQLNRKMQLSRYLDEVSGICFWSGYDLTTNYNSASDALHADYFSHPALIPAYTFIDTQAPKEVKKLSARWTPDGYLLQWKRQKKQNPMQEQVYFCIYRFEKDEPVNLSDGSKLIATTRETSYKLPYRKGETEYTYVVTAVDRMHNESQKGVQKKIKL